MTIELRYSKDQRSAPVLDSGHITGLASVFGKLSRDLGGFVERVDNRAFSASQADGWPDVVARYNHDDRYLLGSTKSGTLQLSTNSDGLFYDVLAPSTRGDVLELVQRGDVTASSFAFVLNDDGDDWQLSTFGVPLRTLTSVSLRDIAPVVSPAYVDTSAAAVDSLAKRFSASHDEVRSLWDRREIKQLFKLADKPITLVDQVAWRYRALEAKKTSPVEYF